MKAVHSSDASCLAPVIDKSAIAFGDQEKALDVPRSISREAIFQVVHGGC